MIDGFLNTLRKTGERVQRRGEEVAQGARLRLDIFQLGREQGEMYARLGRAYHGNAAVSTLEEIRAEIARVDEEIAARELLLAELGAELDGTGESAAGVQAAGTPVNLIKARTPAPSPFTVATGAHLSGTELSQPDIRTEQTTDAQIIDAQTTDPQTALSVWREKEAARMSDENLKPGPVTSSSVTSGPATDATGRPDGEDADPTRTAPLTTAGDDPHSSPYAIPGGQAAATNPNEAGTGDKLQPTADTASMGNEAARDGMVRRDNHLKEGQMATLDPDPLASKD